MSSRVFEKKQEIIELWGIHIFILPCTQIIVYSLSHSGLTSFEIEEKLNEMKTVISNMPDDILLDYLLRADLSIAGAINLYFSNTTSPSLAPQNHNIDNNIFSESIVERMQSLTPFIEEESKSDNHNNRNNHNQNKKRNRNQFEEGDGGRGKKRRRIPLTQYTETTENIHSDEEMADRFNSSNDNSNNSNSNTNNSSSSV